MDPEAMEGEGPCNADGAEVIPPRALPDIENLVFRGGGVKGIAYCGALRILTDLNLLNNVKRVGGSSAGAITAALLALGYHISELEGLFQAQDLTSFKDARGSLLARAERLFQHFALYEGKFFFDWITKLIAAKADPDITFKQVLIKFGKELVIVGTCISHMDVHYFSPNTSPDMTIREALRISMSIPILFEPIKIDDHVYVDGGLGDNFPLCIFDSETLDHGHSRHAEINMKTLGMFLQDDKTRQSVTRKMTNLKDFMLCLLDTVKIRIAQLSLKPGDEERILYIQTHFVSSTKFKISTEEKDLLYHEGQRAARKFFCDLAANIANPTTLGRLVVKLVEGKDLQKRHMTCSVHCVLTVGDVVRKSEVRYKSSNPIWHENFIFTVKNNTDVLRIEVFDAEMLRSPRLMGASAIQLSEFADTKHSADKWVDIGKGKVLIHVTLSTNY